jgi:hypothetical protein
MGDEEGMFVCVIISGLIALSQHVRSVAETLASVSAGDILQTKTTKPLDT